MTEKPLASFRQQDRAVILRSGGSATPFVLDLQHAKRLHEELTAILQEHESWDSERAIHYDEQ